MKTTRKYSTLAIVAATLAGCSGDSAVFNPPTPRPVDIDTRTMEELINETGRNGENLELSINGVKSVVATSGQQTIETHQDILTLSGPYPAPSPTDPQEYAYRFAELPDIFPNQTLTHDLGLGGTHHPYGAIGSFGMAAGGGDRYVFSIYDDLGSSTPDAFSQYGYLAHLFTENNHNPADAIFSAPEIIGLYHFGQATEVLPSGQASYAGRQVLYTNISVAAPNDTDDRNFLNGRSNDIAATVDFATGEIDFSQIAMTEPQTNTDMTIDYENVNILTGESSFTGNGIITLDNNHHGTRVFETTLSGGFYGPNADEIIGVSMNNQPLNDPTTNGGTPHIGTTMILTK